MLKYLYYHRRMETDGLDIEMLTRAFQNLAVLHAIIFDDRQMLPWR